MRAGARRFVTIVAGAALALHTILWAAIAPLAAAPAIDPFTIICHSETSASPDRTPVHGPLAPAHACDHCNLCSAAAPPPAPVTALASRVEPTRALPVLRLVNIARHHRIAADPKLARGPPILA